MAAKGPARASLRYAKAPLSPRYQWELHQLLGHCCFNGMNLRDRVALNIQELRRARSLSQEELAHRADVSRGHMGKLENAKFAASLDLLERIAKALNVDPAELFTKR